MHKQPLHTQRRTAVYLTRVYQKIAFSRGRGRTLCTKSHLVGLLPQLKAMHPTARFVTIVRPIQGIFPSFWSLQCAISRDFGRIDSARPEYLAMRIAFFKEIHARLVALFGSGDAADARVLTFHNFIADPVGQVVDLYSSWGIPASRCALIHPAFPLISLAAECTMPGRVWRRAYARIWGQRSMRTAWVTQLGPLWASLKPTLQSSCNAQC